MWEEDSNIDKLKLDDESLNVQRLVAKYIVPLAQVRLLLQKATTDYRKVRKLRTSYFRGELSKEELKTLEWPQYLGNRPLKNEIEDLLGADDIVIRAQDKMVYLETMLDTLEKIVKAIYGRSFDIKNAIAWTQFTNGLL